MRHHIPALSLLGTLILLPACESAPPHAPPASSTSQGAAPEPDPGLELRPLHDTTAAEVAEVVNDVIASTGDREVHVVADPRRNALLVHGDPVLRAHVRDLVDALDVPGDR